MKYFFLAAFCLGTVSAAIQCISDLPAAPKKFNDSCDFNFECSNSSSEAEGDMPGIICKEGRCVCNIDYRLIEITNSFGEKNWGCERCPCQYLGATHFDKTCQFWYNWTQETSKCWNGANSNFYDLPRWNESCDGTVCEKPYTCLFGKSPNGAERSGNYCQCSAPYKAKDLDCFLECKEDEIYENFVCRKRCKLHEIVLNGTCEKMVSLGQSCRDKRQCASRFSDCKNGKCECFDGFVANVTGNICNSKSHVCPFGEPLAEKNGLVPCTYKTPNSTKPTCPDDHFCLLTAFSADTEPDKSFGHCCQKPKSSCPVGVAHPTASCSETNNTCPSGTHYCYSHVFFWYNASTCCPQGCGTDQIFSDGWCLSTKRFGDQCQITDQCIDENTVCKQGRCVCEDGYEVENKTDTSDRTMHQECVMKCPQGQRLVSLFGCIADLKLGDTCDPDSPSDVCPLNSACSPENKTCLCKCGFWRIGDRNCEANEPTCDLNLAMQLVVEQMGSNSSSITGEKLNFTYCRLPNVSTEIPAVEICEKNRYCAEYISEVGICCPRPEKPMCPDGSVGLGKCDPVISGSCKKGQNCYEYLKSSVEKDAYVCCPDNDTIQP